MHVVVQVVISLLAKLDFLEVHLDANVADKDIFERQALLQTIGALVGDIAEGVEQLFSPVFEQWDLRQESLALLSEELFERFALLDFKEVLVIFDVGHIVEAKITWAVLGKQQLFGRSDLIEELRQ